MAHSIGRLFGVAAAITALLLVPFGGAVASPIRMDDYPSWDDVNAAKANEASKQAEISNLTALLNQLEDKATQLANEALKRGSEYLVARSNLDSATTVANDLQQRVSAADAAAEKAKLQVGAIVAQLYKAGGDTTMNLLLKEKDADSLLYQLGAMSQLTDQTSGLRDAAVAAANNAESLKRQADVALAERDRLEKEAQTSLDTANAAQAAADAQVAEQKTRSATLFAQLAALKNTTAQVEQQYQAGQVAKAAEEQRARELAQQQVDTATGSSYVPGSIATPGEAQNIAAGMLPSYGWGNDAQLSCIINLWNGESGWRVNALNPDSDAYGIPQSLPANKMASVADDWRTNAATQITWGLTYIASVYGSPCNALNTWDARDPHWY